MTPQQFVDAVSVVVRDSATKSVLSFLEKPPGRRPAESLTRLSEWFHGLADEDRNSVAELIAMASDHATFGFLAVLDGARAIENVEDRGTLELRHRNGNGNVLLNDPNGLALSELLKKP